MTERVARRRACYALAGVTVILCSLAAGSAASAPTAAPAPHDGTADRWLESVAPDPEYTGIRIRIDVAPNGTAEWYVEYRYDLPTEAGVEGFNRTSRNITNPPGAFITDMEETVVARAENATGRPMRLEAGSVLTDLDPIAGEGAVVYRFTWTNFAERPAEDRVVVGDAIGRYDLEANESLMIEWPDRLREESTSPEPDFAQSNAIRWTGPIQFRTEDPTVVLRVTGGGSGGFPVVLVAAGLAVVLLLVAGWYGRSRWPGGAAGPDDGTEPDEATVDDTPAELLSDEERVLRLLERRGGRMKQQELIEAVGWSRTKTSDVVNEMHKAEQIELFRLGRENVLALPGEIDV